MKVCGQIFKQSSCCHTLKTPEQNLTSLKGFGLSKISPNLHSSRVGPCALWSPWAHRAPAKPLSCQNGAAGAPNSPRCGCCGTPGLLFVGRRSLCGNSYSLAMPQVQTPARRILLKNSQAPGCDSIRAGSFTWQMLGAAQGFLPAPKSSGEGATRAVSPRGDFLQCSWPLGRHHRPHLVCNFNLITPAWAVQFNSFWGARC